MTTAPRPTTLRDLRRCTKVSAWHDCTPSIERLFLTGDLPILSGQQRRTLASVIVTDAKIVRRTYNGWLTRAELDRLIGILGADYPTKGRDAPTAAAPEQPSGAEQEGNEEDRVEGQSRPKDTDQAEPSEGGSPDATQHGGDGNSGECDHAAQTSASEARTGGDHGAAAAGGAAEKNQQQWLHDPSSSAGQDGSNAEPPEAEHGAGSKAGDVRATCDQLTGPSRSNERSESGEDTVGERCPTQAAPAGTGESGSGEETESPLADAAGCDTPRGDRADVDQPPAKTIADSEGDAAENTASPDSGGVPVTPEISLPPSDGVPSDDPLAEQTCPVRTPLVNHGGTFGDSARADLLARSEGRAAREVRRAIERLVKALDIGGIDESPRLDGCRLVRELRSRRYQIARAHRRELTQPLIVLLCDVSGSCSAVCNETLAACVAVEDSLDGDVVVLRHSNGMLCMPGTDYHVSTATISAWVAEQTRPIGAVVAFGDWDAGDHYRALCEAGADLVWLDSYCCHTAGVKKASAKLREQAKSWKRQPLSWWQGVNDAKSAAIALLAAAKGVP